MSDSSSPQSFFKKHWEGHKDVSDSSSPTQSFTKYFTNYWEGYKDFWCERFSFLNNYSKFIKRDKPLPSWSESDVEDFIALDPVHGPTLKTAREAVNFALTGSVIGAVSTAGITWKYSRSLHGAGLSLLAGGVFGWTFGHEVANHWLQLYRLDPLAAQTRFLEWWEIKNSRQS